MSLRLYNTLSRRMETLKPLLAGEIRMYTCGPTVYDAVHIGNLRTFMFEDLLRRYLVYRKYKVVHVMNITDVDDKTIQRAMAEGRTLAELTGHYTREFEADLKTLNILPAHQLPRATEFIPRMVAGIKILIDKGHAYKTDDGSVYFDVSSFPRYGQLARLDPDQMRAGERVADDDYEKEGVRDFALWKSSKPTDGDIAWPSPWGRGRPGWHMECSAMSTHYLGDHFDLHCGGVDNIFPHHENELAQSQCISGAPFVNLWLHSEHLVVDGQKMSKSLGNFYTLQDILAQGFSPEAVRYTLLATHYRQRLNFTLTKVGESQKAINRLREVARRLEAALPDAEGEALSPPDEAVEAAMDDDLNIAGTLGAIFGWAHELFTLMDHQQLSPSSALEALAALRRYDEILGVIFTAGEADEEVEALVKAREAARSARDWARADAIRDQLLDRGIVLEDTATGTIWKQG